MTKTEKKPSQDKLDPTGWDPQIKEADQKSLKSRKDLQADDGQHGD